MSRREYVRTMQCAEPGCREATVSVSSTRKEQADDYARYAKNPWRCYRHSKPDEVLAADNLERSTVLVAGRVRQSPTRRDTEPGYISGLYWLEGETRRGGGLVSGPGFRAIANDFPPGTRLIVTARIELPESDAGE